MSPDDDIGGAPAIDFNPGETLTPEEQAQFDAMRSGGDLPEPAPQSDPEPTPDPQPEPRANGADPAPAPQPDTDPDIEVTDPKTGTKQKRVSIHKFQRMEERARQAEERAAALEKAERELNERNARIDERLKIINEALATPPQPETPQEDPDPRPDPATDIFAYAEWQGRQIERLNERLSGIESGTREQNEETRLASLYQRDAAAYAQKEAAFADAYVYLFNQRDKELQLAGVTDPEQRKRQIVSEEKGLVRNAINSQRSPAELIFQLALGRGYQRKTTPPPPPPPPPPSPANGKDPKALDAPVTNGAAPPAPSPAPAPAPKPSVTAEIEAIRRGQEAAQSLSNAGGGAPARELTSAVLADMPEEEFNRLVETLPRERLMELMGN